jgi:hypothetical protein
LLKLPHQYGSLGWIKIQPFKWRSLQYLPFRPTDLEYLYQADVGKSYSVHCGHMRELPHQQHFVGKRGKGVDTACERDDHGCGGMRSLPWQQHVLSGQWAGNCALA